MTTKDILTNNEKFEYPLTEKIIIALSLFLVIISIVLTLTNASFRYYFFKTGEEELVSKPIGHVYLIEGAVQRQKALETDFSKLSKTDELYPNDTIMTNSDSRVILELNSGEKLELASNTLVKLAFNYDFSLSSLIPLLQNQSLPKPVVESGSIRVYKKDEKVEGFKISPKKTIGPLVVTDLNPPKEQIFKFSKDEYVRGYKEILTEFKVSRKAEALTLKAYLEPNHIEVFSKPLKVGALDYNVPIIVKRPGAYTWQIQDYKSEVLAESSFFVHNRVEAIEALPVQAKSNKLKNDTTIEEFEGFDLKWKSPSKQGRFKVSVYLQQTRKLVFEIETNKTSIVYGKGSIPIRKQYFLVEQTTPEGFILYSKEQPFGFNFYPPSLTTPLNDEVLSLEKLGLVQKSIYFTWTKTNYTQYYEFEISSDPDFKKIEVSKIVRDNFYLYDAPRLGEFYWRVRSVSEDQKSSYSTPRRYIVRE
jgi:hypothetical protein